MDRGSKRHWLHIPSPAMIVACVALFVALGGTSYAAATLAANSVGTKQIKKNAVTSAKIKSAAVTGAKIKDGAVTGAKIADASLTGAKLADASVDAAKIGALPGARVKLTTATTIVSQEVNTPLSFDATPDFNVGGVYDPAQPAKLTAPIAGRYLITASVRWAANPTGRRLVALDVNAPQPGYLQIARSNVSAFFNGVAASPEQNVSTVYKLNAGDYVGVYVAQNSGAPVALDVGVTNAVTFSMQWIAP